jgi:5-hydroxyisourate hydrolase-like protein (transthyretin family)
MKGRSWNWIAAILALAAVAAVLGFVLLQNQHRPGSNDEHAARQSFTPMNAALPAEAARPWPRGTAAETVQTGGSSKAGGIQVEIRLVSSETLRRAGISVRLRDSQASTEDAAILEFSTTQAAFKCDANGLFDVFAFADFHVPVTVLQCRSSASPIEIRLEPSGGIEGRVVSQGQPVADVRCAATIRTGGATKVAQARTDATGRFRFMEVPVGEAGLKIGDRATGQVVLEGVTVRFAQMTALGDIEMPSAVATAGIVVAKATGEPVSNVRVEIVSTASKRTLAACRTDAEGRFQLAIGVKPTEQVTLICDMLGYVLWQTSEPASQLPGRIELEEDGHPVTIRVINAVNRLPLAGVNLELTGQHRGGNDAPPPIIGQTDGSGLFVSSRLGAGTYFVSCAKAGFVPAEQGFSMRNRGPGSVLVLLKPASSVELVLTHDSSATLEHLFWFVVARHACFSSVADLPSGVVELATVEPLEISGIPPGDFELVVLCQGFIPFVTRFSIPPGPEQRLRLTAALNAAQRQPKTLELPAGLAPDATGTFVFESTLSAIAARQLRARALTESFGTEAQATLLGISKFAASVECDCTEGLTVVSGDGSVVWLGRAETGRVQLSETCKTLATLRCKLNALPAGSSLVVGIVPVSDDQAFPPPLDMLQIQWVRLAGNSAQLNHVHPGRYAIAVFEKGDGGEFEAFSWKGQAFTDIIEVRNSQDSSVILPR